MKAATLKQSAKILSLFEETPSEQVQSLLMSGLLADLRDADVAKIDRADFRRVCGLGISAPGGIIQIPRLTPFNPAQFLGSGWSIWRGPVDGDGLSGDEDQDKRSLALTQLDMSQIQLVTCLKEGETSITGEERVRRLKKTNHIRLDTRVFQTLWENKDSIPESWKEKTNNNTTSIFFDGTPLRSPFGDRYVLCLDWRGGEWDWYYYWLESDWNVNSPSAVLAS